MTDQRIAFICDRKKCKNCNPDCLYTTDINHAANFEKLLAPDTWFESKPTVDAIPIEYIREHMKGFYDHGYNEFGSALEALIMDWREDNGRP